MKITVTTTSTSLTSLLNTANANYVDNLRNSKVAGAFRIIIQNLNPSVPIWIAKKETAVANECLKLESSVAGIVLTVDSLSDLQLIAGSSNSNVIVL